MKKQIYLLLTAILLASSSVMANDVKSKPALTENQIARVASEITRRVEEIKNMDKSDLSRVERKALRNELLEMKKEAKAMNGGVYLSVGAIIIILLVLILIL
jgi:hypothetical protein